LVFAVLSSFVKKVRKVTTSAIIATKSLVKKMKGRNKDKCRCCYVGDNQEATGGATW
jgi:type IV secretory pathway TrbF-like protein